MYTQLLGILLSGLCSTADLCDSGSSLLLHCTPHFDDPGAVLLGTLTISLPPEVAAVDGGSYISDEICFWSLSGGGVDILLESPNGLYPGDSLMWNILIEAVLRVSRDQGFIDCSSRVRVLLTPNFPPAPSSGGAIPIIIHEGYGCAEPSSTLNLLTKQTQRGRTLRPMHS